MICFGASTLMILPVTLPPNRAKSASGLASNCAGARVHMGIREGFVSRSHRSEMLTASSLDTRTSLELVDTAFFANCAEEPAAAELEAAAFRGVAEVVGVAAPE